MRWKSLALTIGASLVLSACDMAASGSSEPVDHAAFEERLQAQLLDAKPGDVITIPAGTHMISRGLSLSADGVTIRGEGMDKSILSFKNQVAGAEGLLVTANDFTIEDLAIEDSKGDGLKVTEGNNIVIRRVRVEWTGGPKTENGAYGLYPVQTTNVLMEGNVAIGASDAGIYVGQSKTVIVRNNRAERNVAGIEIENTIDADVYGNVATGNTGGILVFNMPGLKQLGSRTRVFKNRAVANNTANFGHAGTPVASIPAGVGIAINSNDQVEVFGNEITGNNTANIVVSSVYSTNYSDSKPAPGYDPYPEGIFIHDNTLGGGGKKPGTPELTALRDALFGPTGALPDILWDGFANAKLLQGGQLPLEKRICIGNSGVEVLNADAPGGYKAPRLEGAAHACTLPPLPAVKLAAAK